MMLATRCTDARASSRRSDHLMTDFNGRTILVTGASGGIGGATVRHLVAAGAQVIASGRNVEHLDAIAAETGAEPLPFDLTSEDSIRDAIEGRDIWGVVNSGGWGGEIASPRRPTSTCSTRSSASTHAGHCSSPSTRPAR